MIYCSLALLCFVFADAAGQVSTYPAQPGGIFIDLGDTQPPPIPPEPTMALKSQWLFSADDGSDSVGSFDFTEEGDPTYAATPAYIDGKMAELDGNDAFVKTNSNFLYDNGATSAFTVTGWFYPDGTTKCEVIVINRIYAIQQTIFLIELQTDNDIKARLQAGSTTDTYQTTSQDIWVENRWNFFSFSYDDSDDSVEIYTDSTTDQSSLILVVDATHSTGGTIPQQMGADVVDSFIGVRNGSTYGSRDSYFTGDVADFRVYDTQLTSTEIEAIRDSAGGTAALPIKLGSTQITSVSFGSTEITEVHFGSTKLWP